MRTDAVSVDHAHDAASKPPKHAPQSSFGPAAVHAAGGAALAGLAVAAFMLGIQPVREYQRARTSLVDTVREQEHELMALADQRAQLTDLIETEEAAGAVEVELSGRHGVNARRARLISAAENAGVTVDAVEVLSPVTRPLYAVQPLALRGRGGIDAAAKLLHNCAESLPDSVVTGFSVTSTPRGVSEIRIDLAWYTDRAGAPAEPNPEGA